MAWNEDFGKMDTQTGAAPLGVATLALGAAIGALVTLYFTSRSGEQIRVQANSVGTWKEQAAELLARGREHLISAVEAGREDGARPK